MLRHLVWEKKTADIAPSWEGLEKGARVLVSRTAGRVQVERLSPIALFPWSDEDAFQALMKNGFTMTLQSTLDTLEAVSEADLPEWFRQAISEETKNMIPQKLKNKFPRIFI